jgi:Uma2 family endonuclease
LSYAALPDDAPSEAVVSPIGAPTVAVEILSPDDRHADVDDKTATYLAAGTSAVFIIDPYRETIAVHELGGVRTLRATDTLTHRSLPGFVLKVRTLFARVKR